MEEPPQDTSVEEREELMVSPTGGNPFLRTARFLKPSLTSINTPLSELPSLSPTSFEPRKWPLEVDFYGWKCPRDNFWKDWVDQMHFKHQSVWKEAGIYEAIMNSTYRIVRDNDLVSALAEKFCLETNTFIFSWGESTITLEDMIILGGYSVLGLPVFTPLESGELKETEEEMIEARREIMRTKAKKATQKLWTKKFMDSGSKLEHEAFLALWLSRYVFPNTRDSIVESVFSIAIHLARGIRIALAPAVLATIYRDLRLLKPAIVASTKLDSDSGNGDDVLVLKIFSPFQLVQIWVWERFIELRPKPNLIKFEETRLAQWHDNNPMEVEDVGLALDSAGESFRWRPYATAIANWQFPKFYAEKEMWVLADTDLEEELESFVRCLRVSDLVGLDCIEQYLPHRVAMQFGMDQDLPGHVARCNETNETAWKNYNKQISNLIIYVPPRLFEADVTTRYLAGWKQSVLVLVQQDAIKSVEQQHKIFKLQRSKRKKRRKCSPLSPDCQPNWVGEEDCSEEDELTITELLRHSKNNDTRKADWREEIVVKSGNDAVSEVHKRESIVDGNGEGRRCILERPIQELEDRINRLQNMVAELKASTFGQKQFSRGDTSFLV